MWAEVRLLPQDDTKPGGAFFSIVGHLPTSLPGSRSPPLQCGILGSVAELPSDTIRYSSLLYTEGAEDACVPPLAPNAGEVAALLKLLEADETSWDRTKGKQHKAIVVNAIENAPIFL